MDAEVTNTPTQQENIPTKAPEHKPERGQFSGELVDRLIRLCQIDIDASYAYETALDFIETEDETFIRSLERIRDDHNDHVFNLQSAIYGMGAEPPDTSLDWNGFILEGFTTVSSISGTPGALQALRVDEQIVRDSYEDAMSWEVPNDLHRLLQEHRNDEERHDAILDDALKRFGVLEADDEDENTEERLEEEEEDEDRPPTMQF